MLRRKFPYSHYVPEGGAFVVVLGLLLMVTVAGCRPKTREVGATVAPVVPVSHPIERVVTDYVDFTGRTDAVQSVNIVARVTGYLVKIPFAVFSGMFGVTLFGIFLTPGFFYVIIGVGESRLFTSAVSRWLVSCFLAACDFSRCWARRNVTKPFSTSRSALSTVLR